MKRGYIRLTPAGPTENEQREALSQAGVDSVDVEPAAKIGDSAGRRHALRDRVIQALELDDVFVIASPGCFGAGRADVLLGLGQIAMAGASLHVVSRAATIRWSPEAAAAAQFAAEAETEGAAWRARQARMARPSSRLGGRKSNFIEGAPAYAEAKALWADASLSAADIVRKVGVSRSKLYRAFGPRAGPS